MQLVNLRVTATGALEALSLSGTNGSGEGTVSSRTAHFRGAGAVECAVYRRDGLAAGASVEGPGIIESMDSTVLVPPGWRAGVDGKGYIVMEAN